MPDTITIEDLLELQTLSDVAMTRDGARIAFVVRPSSHPKGTPAEGRIWIADGDQTRAVTRGPGNDALPVWSPDGSALAFTSDRARPGLLSLYLLDFTGESRRLGNVEGAVEQIRWSDDGRTIIVLAADPGSDRAGAQTATRIEAGEAVADPVVRRPRQEWRRLFRIDVATGETTEVSPDRVNVWEFDWHGGDTAVAIVSDDPTESGWYDAVVALLDLNARSSTTLHDAEWQLQSPTLSADGSKVAFVEGLGSDRAVLTGTVFVTSMTAPAATALAAELDVTAVGWVGADRLAYLGVKGCETMCGRVSLDGTVEEAWRGPATLGHTHRFTFAHDAQATVFAAAKQAPNEPEELCVLRGGAWQALTSFNAQLAGRVTSTVERITWSSDYPEEIEGLLVLPANRGDSPLPLVVISHGGPTNAWTYVFSHGYSHLGLLLAENGYAVLMPNVRGSTGRGQDFARANLGDIGGGDLRDILAGMERLVQDGVVDAKRIGVTGGSYGGTMSSFAPTQTDAFAAAVPFSVGTNWFSFHNTTNIARFDEVFMQADPYDPNGAYYERSAVMHARKCRTPMLIMHGALDLCCPVSQAQEMYQALVEAGCETELVIYAQGGHGWSEREYAVDTWQRTRDWYDRFLAAGR